MKAKREPRLKRGPGPSITTGVLVIVVVFLMGLVAYTHHSTLGTTVAVHPWSISTTSTPGLTVDASVMELIRVQNSTIVALRSRLEEIMVAQQQQQQQQQQQRVEGSGGQVGKHDVGPGGPDLARLLAELGHAQGEVQRLKEAHAVRTVPDPSAPSDHFDHGSTAGALGVSGVSGSSASLHGTTLAPRPLRPPFDDDCDARYTTHRCLQQFLGRALSLFP